MNTEGRSARGWQVRERLTTVPVPVVGILREDRVGEPVGNNELGSPHPGPLAGGGPDLVRDINERRAELRARRDQLQRQLAGLDDEVHRAPNPALLDQLPVTSVALADMPDQISRQLFEALRLEIRYDFTTHVATCQITLSGDTIDPVARTSQEAVASPPQRCRNTHADIKAKTDTPRQPPAGMVCAGPLAGFEPAPALHQRRDGTLR